MTSTTTAISWNEPEIDTSVNNFVEDLPSKLKRFDIPSTQHWPRSGPKKDVTLIPSLPDTFPATDDVS
ncbi:hypothetical protein KP79_PYT18948 [Mizuhopecten yessoensis]|uniref:Uncharacterized protein n=1 Tax=Mizuhopecten yessoensis TaxID=6573 RepID=A0A210QZM1_MIZYE|nr:hypothetical protein KP79_PYT18948 [Mizuhopecten yessoensis]